MSPTERDRATADLQRAVRDRRKSTLYSDPAIRRAAVLLADLRATGECHGITAYDWGSVTSLAATALDVVHYRPAPQNPHVAEALIKDAYAALEAALRVEGIVGVVHRRDLFSIALDPPPVSVIAPTRSTYHPAGSKVALAIDAEIGWSLFVDVPGACRARSITLVAPFDTEGAVAAADVFLKVNCGLYGDSLFTR